MSDTIQVTDTYTVGPDEALRLHDVGFVLLPTGGSQPELIVEGSVTVIDRTDGSQCVGVSSANGGQTSVTIQRGGQFVVTCIADNSFTTGFYSSSDASVFTNRGSMQINALSAYGVYAQAGGLDFNNAGDLVIDCTASAWGVVAEGGVIENSGRMTLTAGDDAYGLTGGPGMTFDNSGALRLSAGFSATGIDAYQDAEVTNSGRIVVTALVATGIILESGADKLDNSGLITATIEGDGTAASAIGVQIRDATPDVPAIQIINTGTIIAAVAISAFQPVDGQARAIDIANAGKIVGGVELANGDDQLHNTGKIIGDVSLAEGADLYEGANGMIRGFVDGGEGRDSLFGGSASDDLRGGAGADLLTGGGGADRLDGGSSRDVFRYDAVSDSAPGSADMIVDLQTKDLIDLSRVDADTTLDGDQAFHLVVALDGHAGELTLSFDKATHLTTLSGDVDGDGVADLVIEISGDRHDFTHFAL